MLELVPCFYVDVLKGQHFGTGVVVPRRTWNHLRGRFVLTQTDFGHQVVLEGQVIQQHILNIEQLVFPGKDVDFLLQNLRLLLKVGT